MALPPRVFFTFHETAARWGCTIADIAGWACEGKLEILTGISAVTCGANRVSGKVMISPMDILPMFRRSGTGPTAIKLMRIKPADSEEWGYVTEPIDGVDVSIADLLITGHEVLRFEEEHDLLRRVGGGTGAVSPYDWEGMYVTVMQRVHEKGLPATQSEFVAELQDWFAEVAHNGEVPDESTIRRRLRPIWRALRGES
tara:strand:+ start:369 stop:965 length:597 start_codon:yes stop_codon:yes gene_type:complete